MIHPDFDSEPDDFEPPFDFHFIDRCCDPVTQKIQKYIGLDCFFWAKVLLRTAFIIAIVNLSIIVFSVCVFRSSVNVISLLGLAAGVFRILSLGHYFWCPSCNIDSTKVTVYRELACGRRNALIFCSRSIEYLIYFVVLMPIIHYLNGLTPWSFLFVTIAGLPWTSEYIIECLCACTPLPPTKSVLRQKLESLQEKFGELFGGNPEAHPA